MPELTTVERVTTHSGDDCALYARAGEAYIEDMCTVLPSAMGSAVH